MLSAQPEFIRREAEIAEYIAHLEILDRQIGMSPSLMNTMKSSALLMIYNIVESTMTNLMQDVFDHMQANGVDFGKLNNNMKEVVLSTTRRRNPKALVDKMSAASIDLAIACFDRADVFSGNLDSKKIRDTLHEIGIPTTHTYRETALQKVKTERNDLAHGVKSFSDCGRSYTTGELRDFHAKTSVVLSRAIQDFEAFLTNRGYC